MQQSNLKIKKYWKSKCDSIKIENILKSDILLNWQRDSKSITRKAERASPIIKRIKVITQSRSVKKSIIINDIMKFMENSAIASFIEFLFLTNLNIIKHVKRLYDKIPKITKEYSFKNKKDTNISDTIKKIT